MNEDQVRDALADFMHDYEQNHSGLVRKLGWYRDIAEEMLTKFDIKEK